VVGGRWSVVSGLLSVVCRPSSVVPLLAAVSPVLVYYSQETRMYALLALLAAGSTWVLLNWLDGAGGRWAVAYVLLVAAGLYTHYFFPAVVAAQGLIVMGRRRPEGRRPTTDDRPRPEGRSDTVGGRLSAVGGRLSAVVHWLLLAAAAWLFRLPPL